MNRHAPTERRQTVSGCGFVRPAGFIIMAVLIGLFAVLFSAFEAKAKPDESETIVSCDPTVAAGVVGQPLEVNIYVENVTNLAGADVQFSFDPTVAQIVDTDSNATGVQIRILDEFFSPDFVLRRIGDNEIGSIWYAGALTNASEPVSGSGPLARITFVAQEAGSFTMPITYQKLVHQDGAQIEVTPVNCQITFIEMDDPDLMIYLPVSFAQDN